MTQKAHVIKSGETPKQVADKFGVSVRELLSYNSPVLGGRWYAGTLVRDPKHTEKKVKEAVEKGATAEQIASVLNISVDKAVEQYGVLREDELQEIPKEQKKVQQALDEIEVPKRAGKIDEIEVPKRAGRVSDIVVPDRAKKIVLEEIEVPERKPVPTKVLSNIKVPERARKLVLEDVEVPDRNQKAVPAPYTDYESVMGQRLAEVTTPDRKPVPTEVLQEVTVPERELAEPLKPKGITVPQSAIDLYKPKEVKPQKKITVPQSAIDIRKDLAKEQGERIGGLVREAGEGITLGLLGELTAAVQAATTDKTYERAKAEYEVAREQFIAENPELSQLATPVELIATLPTGIGLARGLAKAGVKSLGSQAAIESAIYGAATGENEDRLYQGIGYGFLGGLTGRLLDNVVDSNLGKRVNSVEALNKERANIQQKIIKEAKIVRPSADISNDELATQLLLRETEFLADTIGRQGALPKEIGAFYQRMVKYGEDMGVDIRQINRVVRSNKDIKTLRSMLNESFESLDDIALLRQDLLDITTGRLAADVGRTIPEAQNLIVKLRRLASPLATLAEETVGTAFSQRLIRAMNRVTRQQTDLDTMWKGMEPFRELAETNSKFNDLLLDAVNAENIGIEAAEKALKAAMKVADSKIGSGASDRLRKFLDDNVEFSRRYRREVTTGPVTPVWMHSASTLTGTDSSLRTFRQRAAQTAQDDASKDRTRLTMKEWREANSKRPADKQREYQNIFDSHWTWQRQTLTRMELGKQLGFRTAGKPLEPLKETQLRKKAKSKKELDQGASDLDATASYEAGQFKLFDRNIIEEALKKEGYSKQQIDNAIEIIDDLGVNANKGMANELEVIRSLGYVGTIANPYGALMNVHDLFNASFELGLKNVLGSLFANKGIRFSPEDMGLARQVFGEFVRKARKGTQDPLTKLGANEFLQNVAEKSESLLQFSMNASGFAKLDQFGKSRIMGASFRKAKEDIANGTFDQKWSLSFSKGEIDQLKRDIAADAIDSELVRDLVMFDLFRLQPINAAAQTAFGLSNPNARLFYMLKGFAIKQFDLMERRIIREWQAGNKKQALENAAKYLVLSGGGYGIVNEGRQVLKGEAPDPEEAAVSAFYQVGSVLTFGAMGANDYGYDKFMDDPVWAFATNLLPPVGATLPGAVLEDIADAVRTGDPLPDETIYALPVVGKTLKGVFD